MIQDQGNNIAESEKDFEGYTILYIEHWKENVRRVHMTKDKSFYIVYAKEEYTKNLIEQ